MKGELTIDMAMVINVKNDYLRWLIMTLTEGKNDYTNFLTLMHDTPFVALHPMDRNRMEDVNQLRDMWLDTIHVKDDNIKLEYAKELLSTTPSLLEVIYELCIKINDNILYIPNDPNIPVRLFWKLINNMVRNGNFGSKYVMASQILSDNVWDYYVNDAVKVRFDIILNKKYMENGKGGFFPLKDRNINQRKEELWTVATAYVKENPNI